ncbi:MAG: HAMP domain-containing histidine kinase [Planctomycetes bacterium]|nr:HAMP domain-containing histidine kinase [Planctomycetota bacterium]
MRATPVILLVLIVCLPLGVLAWLGQRMASDEQTVIEQRFRGLLTAQLKDIDQIAIGHFATTQRELRRLARLESLAPADIRAVLREAPLVRQIFVYSPDGDVLHPNPAARLNAGEQDFLLKAEDLILDRDVFYAAGGKRRVSRPPNPPAANPPAREAANRGREAGSSRGSENPTRSKPPVVGDDEADEADATVDLPGDAPVDAEENDAEENDGNIPPKDDAAISPSDSMAEGWHIWYQDRGVHLIYWQRLASGHVVGLLAERSRWMADLIATLPQTVDDISTEENAASDPAADISTSRIRLLDSSGRPVYQWGNYEPESSKAASANQDPTTEEAFAEIPISPPLTSWRLQAFVPPNLVRDASRSARFSMNASLAAAAVALALLVAFFWREYRRELREASQRVSFVNQVSHELRTPLTNIRMYADLLESDLERMPEDETEQPKSRLKVIAEESQRLSRLIGNVLTMARQQRNTLTLKPQPAIVDDVIRDVLRQFEPALSRCQVEATFEARAGGSVSVDVDVLEQILVNLFSNVEKYAASGGVLNVASSQADEKTTITVSDSGPGIATRQRAAIFRPFYRSSDRLEDAAGTGIGLSIAKELAQLHGGDVRLVDSTTGASFEVTLKTRNAK